VADAVQLIWIILYNFRRVYYAVRIVNETLQHHDRIQL